jgi:hypothetical protein
MNVDVTRIYNIEGNFKVLKEKIKDMYGFLTTCMMSGMIGSSELLDDFEIIEEEGEKRLYGVVNGETTSYIPVNKISNIVINHNENKVDVYLLITTKQEIEDELEDYFKKVMNNDEFSIQEKAKRVYLYWKVLEQIFDKQYPLDEYNIESIVVFLSTNKSIDNMLNNTIQNILEL